MLRLTRRNGTIAAAIGLAFLFTAGTPAQAAPPDTNTAPAPQASASWLEKNPIAVARAADAAGFIIVPRSDSFPYEGGTMYPTGPISSDTLVVIPNPDGSLPGGLTKTTLEKMVAAKRQGLDPATAVPTAEVGLMSSSAWWPAGDGGWGKLVNLGSFIGWTASARAGYSYNTGMYTTASGNGVGWEYKCVSSTYCGQVSAFYFVGFANQYTAYYSSGSVPWGNVAANREFRGRCVTTPVCGGTAS